MLQLILYPEYSDRFRFADLSKRARNDYVLNKAEYPRTVSEVQSLLLNFQPNYNSNGKSITQVVRNRLMFA